MEFRKETKAVSSGGYGRMSTMETKVVCAIISCFCLSGLISGQTSTTAKYPFPQNVKYPYGVMSTKVTNDFVQTWYNNWKKKYLQECSGNLRPGVDPLTKSLVEAQGFSMIAVAYMGDKDIFDKLYNYYKAKCKFCGMMEWKQTCTGGEGGSSATDGDVDVACALVVANWQWPDGGYAEKAKGVISNLKKLVVNCSGVSALAAGCGSGGNYGGCSQTDISYYEPAFFRYFAKLTGDAAWTKLADDDQTIRDAAADKTTGLVPDWQTASGTPGGGGQKGYYSFDAIRVPYKQTLDFLWNGNPKAEAWCKKISTWANGVGPSKIVDGYQLNGSKQGSSANMAAEGSLAVAAMANTQEVADAFAAEAIKKKDDYWYSGYLGNLYLLAMSGNMWNPDIMDKTKSAANENRAVPARLAQPRIKNTLRGDLAVSGLPQAGSIYLVTTSGQMIKTSSIVRGSARIDLTSFRSGYYLLNVRDENGRTRSAGGVSVF
jgi:endoglucanase